MGKNLKTKSENTQQKIIRISSARSYNRTL